MEHSLLCSVEDRSLSASHASSMGSSDIWMQQPMEKETNETTRGVGANPASFVPLTGSSHLHEFCGAMAEFV